MPGCSVMNTAALSVSVSGFFDGVDDLRRALRGVGSGISSSITGGAACGS